MTQTLNDPGRETPLRATWLRWLPLMIVAAGAGVYLNSFSGVFLLDDNRLIVSNYRLHHLWPLWNVLSGTTRPVITLSLAFNYALGGLEVWGYHLVNVTIHLLAALTLFGLVRRTLLTEQLRARYAAAAPWLAFVTALLWVVHPLQTESVTYIIQRGESLMGLFYLLTFYALSRGASANQPRRWYAAAVLACAAGMASKPVMVTAPLLALAYDRIFLAGSVRSAWRVRKRLYLGLAATWLVLMWCLLTAPHDYTSSAGFAMKEITWFEYARTQPGILLYYLRLAVWPHPLVLDYGWPIAKTLGAILPPLLLTGALLLATAWAWRARPALSFLGLWYFGILAPSSSVIPIADLAFEHRMYLPLAGVLVLGVMGLHALLRRGIASARLRQGVTGGLVLVITLVLGGLTMQRNTDYHSGLTIWRDAIAKRPQNYRPYNNLGVVLAQDGAYEEALAQYDHALRLKPDSPEAHNNRGLALAEQEHRAEAMAEYREALRLRYEYPDAHNNLGLALAAQEQFPEAIKAFTEALKLKPDHADAHNNLANALAKQGRFEEAEVHYRVSLQLRAESALTHNNLGATLSQEGKIDEAIAHFAEALRLQPEYPRARNNLGNALFRQGRLQEAIDSYTEALASEPEYAEAHYNLGKALMQLRRFEDAAANFSEALRLEFDTDRVRNDLGLALSNQDRYAEAIPHYTEALNRNPRFAEAHHNLGVALAHQGNFEDAMVHVAEALRLRPDNAQAHNSMGNLLLFQGRMAEAIAEYEEALRLQPDYADARHNVGVARAQQAQGSPEASSAAGAGEASEAE